MFLRLLSFVAPGATCLVRVPRRVTLAVLLERNAVFLAVMNWWRLFRGDGQVEQRRAGSSLQAGHEAQRVPGLQVMVQEVDITEVEIDGRTFWVRPVGPDVLQSGNVVAAALAESLDKPFPWAVGFLFGNTELSMELWTVIAGISGLDD